MSHPEPLFSMNVRVYYEDTDAGGVVYHANYLRFMERARTEWLRSLGFDQRRLRSEANLVFAVTRINLEYRRPACLDDELTVTVEMQDRARVSMQFTQRILKGDELLSRGSVKVACIDARRFRPRLIPECMRNVLLNPENGHDTGL